MLWSYEQPLKGLILLWINWSQPMFEVKASEHCITCMMIQYDSWASYRTVVLNAPESYVLFPAWSHPTRVDRTESQLKDIEIRGLLGDYLRFAAPWCPNTRDVPDHNHFLIVGVFAHTGQVLAIVGEGYTLEDIDGHSHHRNASATSVFPYTDDRVFSFLSTGNECTICIYVKAADWGWVTEKEPLLLCSTSTCILTTFNVHSDQGAPRGENDYIRIIREARPFQIQTPIWWVSYYMS